MKLGIIVKTLEFQKSDKPDVLATSERSKLTEKLDVIEYPGYEDFQERNFNQAAIDAYRQNGAIPASFQSDLAKASGSSKFDAKLLYGRVIAAIGTPDKEYIIKPDDGLINSIRCLCFPTIVGYLKQWRNIMGAVKSCVDTILLTGDGENGVCQAVVSQYVCDLLYDALACFTQKFSTGQGRVGKEGSGDIMGALVASGSEMSREVQGRYGETGLYKAVFVDRKLVHSICMFAFTGTWNFDLGAVFDQSIDEIPLSSQALLTPCNRRYVNSNPTTRPGGLVTWVYHFGTFISAGADIDVELHLVCSDDFTCKESDGYENGKCDCQGRGKRDIVIRPENLATRTKKNQILNEEIFYTMQAGSGESNVRYDKAYLLYRWKEANKQMKEDKTEPCSISQTGGGGSVPGICRWDPFTVSFRCSFGEAAGGVRFKEGKPEYSHNTQGFGGVFIPKENLNISISLQQDYPGGEQYNKYLQYTVLGPGGKELASNKERGLLLLQTNGDYVKKLSAETAPIEIKKEWMETTEAGKTFLVAQWTSKNPAATAENKVVDSAQLIGLSGVITTRKQYVLELSNKVNTQSYAIYNSGIRTQLLGGGFFKTDPPICTGTIQGNRITCTPQPITPRPGQAPAPQETLTITLKPDAQKPVSDETLQLHIDMNVLPTLARNFCTGDVKTRQLQQFTVQLMAFDADKYGSPTEQVSIDSYTGAEAVFTVPFNVLCATEDEVKPLEGILGPADILAGLRVDVAAFKQRQEKYLSDIDKWLTGGIKIENSATIQQQLSTIISTELADAAVLQTKYLKNLEGKPELQNIATVTTQLNSLIGQVPVGGGMTGIGISAALSAFNVPAQATITREAIMKTTSAEEMQTHLQMFRPILVNAIAKKDELLKLLPAAAGEKGGCPTGQTIAGSYYECTSETRGDPWGIESDKTCQTTTPQTCYRVNAENLCTGTDTKGDAYHCDTTCTGNSFISPDQTRICRLTEEQTCCVVKSTTLQKLLALKNLISVGNEREIIDDITAKETLSDPDMLLLVAAIPPEQPWLVRTINDVLTLKQAEQIQLKKDLSAMTAQNIKIPAAVTIFVTEEQTTINTLNTARTTVLGMDLPTAADVRTVLRNVKTAIEKLSVSRSAALSSINRELGIVPAGEPQIQPEIMSLPIGETASRLPRVVPIIVSPINNEAFSTRFVTFAWTDPANEGVYDLQFQGLESGGRLSKDYVSKAAIDNVYTYMLTDTFLIPGNWEWWVCTSGSQSKCSAHNTFVINR
jgi:hypothetical protein